MPTNLRALGLARLTLNCDAPVLGAPRIAEGTAVRGSFTSVLDLPSTL